MKVGDREISILLALGSLFDCQPSSTMTNNCVSSGPTFRAAVNLAIEQHTSKVEAANVVI